MSHEWLLCFALCFCVSAGDFCSVDDGSRGTTMAVGDLHTDNWPAHWTSCALLLAKGMMHVLNAWVVQ